MFAVVVRYTVADKTRTRELPLRVFLQHRGRSSRWSRHGHTLVRILRLSARVSMMNLFNLQFEQVDVGRWLKLLSGRDYEVRTFGIARSISGVEKLDQLLPHSPMGTRIFWSSIFAIRHEGGFDTENAGCPIIRVVCE